MRKQKLIAVHLLNDRSGSPLVLRQSLETLKDKFDITLYTATPSGNGFLSDIEGIKKEKIYYKWNKNKLLTLLYFLYSQCSLFWKILKTVRKNDIVYINTLLPFGAALAAKWKGCKVIYHIHEVSIRPKILKSFLVRIVEFSASKVLFVSAYVSSHYHFKKIESSVIYNCLPADFVAKATLIREPNMGTPFTVLMLCSLKAYKGVYEFINIASQLTRIKFILVLNASTEEVDEFNKENKPSSNCKVLPAQKDTFPFYQQAHLVVNLSRPDGWVETFGLTVLEAMTCCRAVIVPPVGGVCELVKNGVEGFHVDSRDEKALLEAIETISSDMRLYIRMSKAAAAKSATFSLDLFQKKIKTVIEEFSIDDDPLPIMESIPPDGINPFLR